MADCLTQAPIRERKEHHGALMAGHQPKSGHILWGPRGALAAMWFTSTPNRWRKTDGWTAWVVVDLNIRGGALTQLMVRVMVLFTGTNNLGCCYGSWLTRNRWLISCNFSFSQVGQ